MKDTYKALLQDLQDDLDYVKNTSNDTNILGRLYAFKQCVGMTITLVKKEKQNEQ